MTTPCPRAAEVDAHFDAKAPSFGARALFAHLPSCTSCRARYERHLALESLDPEAPGAKERMRRGLAPPGRARRWYLPVGGAIALAACLMLVLGRPGTGDGFSPRGATSVPTDAPRVEIYKVTPGAPPERVDGAIARQDELAFAYANPSGKKRLLVFAVDENRKVYWYYPAWTDAALVPTAVPIAASRDLVELHDAVRQPIETRRVAFFALFTDEPLDVRAVEARVAAAPTFASPLGLVGTVEAMRQLEVR